MKTIVLGLSGLLCCVACGKDVPGDGQGVAGTNGTSGAQNTAGAQNAAGASSSIGGSPSAGAGGAPITAGAGGAPITAGAGGAPITAGAGGVAITAGAGGAFSAGAAGMSTAGAGGGSAGAAATNDLSKVVPTAGCGLDPAGLTPGQTVKGSIATMGIKPASCADSQCGAWSYDREYFVTLPTGYVKTKAYPLVFEGPGCGGDGQAVYPLTDPTAGNAPNAGNTVIRVGLTPPPNAIGHATNPNQGCFDDKEGDSSVDWVLYENLYDKLAASICFDRNRVFASGNSSGAWFSNELGCKYAGDATRPVRGVMANTGGLPTDAKYVPTCTDKPMAGMWVNTITEPDNSFAGNQVAINRAISVNKCTGGNWPTTPTTNYPIGGGKADTTCKQITGCPALYPIVVCVLPSSQSSNDDTANPGFTTFLKFFSTPPQLMQ